MKLIDWIFGIFFFVKSDAVILFFFQIPFPNVWIKNLERKVHPNASS